MDTEMDASPSYFDPEDLSSRQQYRRYRKRQPTSNISPVIGSSVSRFSEATLLYEENDIQKRPNAALLLEEIKKEVDIYEEDSSKQLAYMSSNGLGELETGFESTAKANSLSLKTFKNEEDVLSDGAESIFSIFASLLDSALQGLMSFPDLILQFENTCRSVSAAIRYGNFSRHRVVEDKFIQKKARLLLDEAASWSLMWYLFGKANEELTEDLLVYPTTSHQEACRFVTTDHTAQLCLRLVLWLEGLASVALELEQRVRGSSVGSYLPSSGIWHHTQRFLKKHKNDPDVVRHIDFDAPTREMAKQLPDDRNQEELLLEDIWSLLRAGRLEEACELCRSAGQPWRAASLCPFGGLDHFPSIEAMNKNGKSRVLQAVELESGIAQQWRLWKWTSYCASEKIAEHADGRYEMAIYAAQCSNLNRLLPVCLNWESACWAMVKCWLDFQIDLELSHIQSGRVEEQEFGEDSNGSSFQDSLKISHRIGPDRWPYHVLDQQPRDISALLQKLHSGEIVHDTVACECKEQHRKVEMSLMVGDVAHLLDLLWSWMSPMEDNQNVMRPNGDPQMIRFGAHVVLVLRYLLGDEMKESFREKLAVVGDRILHMYAMFLFVQQREELVGIYASQLARHLCIDLFVNCMELQINGSLQIKYKLFLSAVEYLPFSSIDKAKASFDEIIERILCRSREIKAGKYEGKPSDVAEQHRLQSLQKAMVIQWLCFTPPSTVKDFELINAKLLQRALRHSNVLFREFSLISMWRSPKMPIGAHMLLGFLAEPLKQPKDNILSPDECDVQDDDLHEFEDWHEYYSCDASYRKWLKIELEKASVPPADLSVEEKEQAASAARESLNSSFALISRVENPWLDAAHQSIFDESMDVLFLEVHAIAMLCLPSGECFSPDAVLCATLTGALYSSVSEDDALKRQLSIDVSVASRDCYSIEVSVRCLAVKGDGLGFHEANDGGLVATVLASGFKGELRHFQAGVTMEISRLDARYCDADGPLEVPAVYIVRGLCRRCCLPETVLRCLQVSVSLAEYGSEHVDHHDELIELVASAESGLLDLFSQNQLQEFLLFERECTLYQMELEEESSIVAVDV